MNMGNSKTEINSGFNLKWLYSCVFFTQVVFSFPGAQSWGLLHKSSGSVCPRDFMQTDVLSNF